MGPGRTLLTAIPVPLGLAAGFLVPSGEDKLLLWLLGVAVMSVLYATRAIRSPRLAGGARDARAAETARAVPATPWQVREPD